MIDLQDKHSFSIAAKSAHVEFIHTLNDLESLQWHEDSFLLGEGTNTVFLQDFSGHLIVNRIKGITITDCGDSYSISAAGGENWHHCVSTLVQNHIFGLENLALIPGSVGAAPVQNIGAYGVEVGEFIDLVEGIDLRDKQAFSFDQRACRFGYRDSIFKQPQNNSLFITRVRLRLPKAWQARLDYPDLASLPNTANGVEIFNHVVKVRQQKLPDPQVLPNAGSFFKNPIVPTAHCRQLRKRYPDLRYFDIGEGQCKLAAAWLIDEAGLKSLRVGGAGVHQRQALVLVNMNKATGDDLIQLAQQVCKQVKQLFNVVLEPEVRLLGANGLIEL